MRLLLIILVFFNILSADNSRIMEFDICVTDNWNENGKCHVIYYVDSSEHILKKQCYRYTWDDNCTDNSKLAMSENYYNYLMGFSGLLFGWLFFGIVLYIFSFMGRK